MLIEIDLEKIDAETAIELGYALENGTNGFVKNYEAAFSLYREAALDGDPVAINNMGWMYENGFNCDKDLEIAKEYYSLAADKGYSLALINLGNLAEAKKDYENAYNYYLDASKQGNLTGTYNLANMYHWGWYVKQDYSVAFELFKYLSSKEYPGVDFYLGLYAEKGYAQDINYKLAAMHYEKGTLEGDCHCPNQLGRMFALGLGIQQDYETAFKLYQEAIELGDSLGYANVGYCYETGQGVEQNIKEAKLYYSKGVELGEEHCIAAMARLQNE